jgi:transcriptional regulator with XRE-family HTH domain
MGVDPSDAYKADRTNYLETFGRNVRKLREKVRPRLSQERLSEITGLHRTEIGKIEHGQVDPRLITLHLVAHALNAEPEDLLKGLRSPPQRDLWARDRRTPSVDSEPPTDGRESREKRAKEDR